MASSKNTSRATAKVRPRRDGLYDRSQLPYYYALADRFTMCDRWFASVMGPTWPNRFIFTLAHRAGKRQHRLCHRRSDDAVGTHERQRLRRQNYIAGAAAWYWGAYPGKMLQINPSAKLDEFFKDCKTGRCRRFRSSIPTFWQTTIIQATTCSLGRR